MYFQWGWRGVKGVNFGVARSRGSTLVARGRGVNFGQAMDFFRLISWPSVVWPSNFGDHILGLFRLHPSSFSKCAGFVFPFGKALLVSISVAIPLLRPWHVYFPLELEFRGKSCVEWEHGGEDGISCLLPSLYIIIVYRVNMNKLSRNFVGALRTTTTNCRVSFIDLYLVFPGNFRIVFLPHTNTVILLEPYCGTITEPGLPVVLVHWRICECLKT